MWSGGSIKSTIHRVVYNNPAGTPRFSIPFFLHPSRGSSINCGPDAPAIDSYRWVGVVECLWVVLVNAGRLLSVVMRSSMAAHTRLCRVASGL
jgi:hypothetical protein